MKCPECQAADLVETRENHRYTESGLPNVVLQDVLVRRCPSCGAHLVSLPRLAELHRCLALVLINKEGRLSPDEIRFLRKSLGWSGADFARKFHVRPEQVSRWESDKSRTRMSISNELLLRSMVAHGNRVENYPDRLDVVATIESHDTPILALQRSEQGWRMAA